MRPRRARLSSLDDQQSGEVRNKEEWGRTEVIARLQAAAAGAAMKPVRSVSPDVPLVGSTTGEYTDRGTIFLEFGVNFGPGPAVR
ncbi:MAG: hypothetical protein ACR2QZ_13165 [Woeseiaceae bacterium]